MSLQSQLLGKLRQENLLHPGDGAKIVPLHSSLGDRARLHLRKKKNRNRSGRVGEMVIGYKISVRWKE